jgi:hypothetical protein
MAQELPTLTLLQMETVEENWDKIKFVDLVKLVSGDPTADGRSLMGRAIKAYLGDRKPIYGEYVKKPEVVLTEEQKEYIKNNIFPAGAEKPVTGTVLAREVFNKPNLCGLDLETKAVVAYIKTLPQEISKQNLSDDTDEEYRAPSTLKQITEAVNKYLLTKFDYTQLSAAQKRTFESLLAFVSAPRYLQMMNSYKSKSNRVIFEGEFIRTIYDKPDLTPDDINLCINLCWNYVQMITINRHLDILNERYEIAVQDIDTKISTPLADMITAKTQELKECDNRQQKIINALNSSRSERNKNKKQDSLSLAHLIEWWKDDKERKARINREELRKQEVGEELNRLENMSELKCRIAGFTRSELLN